MLNPVDGWPRVEGELLHIRPHPQPFGGRPATAAFPLLAAVAENDAERIALLRRRGRWAC